MELLDKETLEFLQAIVAFVVVPAIIAVMMGIAEGFKWLQRARNAHLARERKIIDMSIALAQAITVIRHEVDNGRYPSLLAENPQLLSLIRD
tara:strand:+ start:280 stop:555 length:276 start_codon:yes stop_codon:yes gene_type:complete